MEIEKRSFADKAWDIIGKLLMTPCREKTLKADQAAKEALKAIEVKRSVCEEICSD